MVTRVVVHLAATGLLRPERHLMAQPFQKANDRNTGLSKQEIVITRDEKRYTHSDEGRCFNRSMARRLLLLLVPLLFILSGRSAPLQGQTEKPDEVLPAIALMPPEELAGLLSKSNRPGRP